MKGWEAGVVSLFGHKVRMYELEDCHAAAHRDDFAACVAASGLPKDAVHKMLFAKFEELRKGNAQ